MTDEYPVLSYDAPIHVLDLPHLYTRPSAPILFDTLTKLTIKSTVWSLDSEKSSNALDSPVAIDEDGIPRYLTSIIASPLRWIEDDPVRERVWEMASARLSERSGRTAQPTQTRTFTIPLHPSFNNPLEPFTTTTPPSPLQITLHEPTLTADNLGHKTWLSSYLLARRLPTLLNTYLLPKRPPRPPHSQAHNQTPIHSPRILELGSGTGLLGLTAAALLPHAQVHLTDLAPILGNLAENVRLNAGLFAPDNFPEVGVLDWSAPPRSNGDGGEKGGGSEKGDTEKTSPEKGTYDLILSSDPLYSPSHPAWLVQTILSRLSPPRPPLPSPTPPPSAQPPSLLIELPLRTAYLPQIDELRARLREAGLELLDQGEEVGREDWGGGGGGDGWGEVRCWWGVWGWAA